MTTIRVTKGLSPVRPWAWAHAACGASAGRATHDQALRDALWHLHACPGHP